MSLDLQTYGAVEPAVEHNVKTWCKWAPEHGAALKALMDDGQTYVASVAIINARFGTAFTRTSAKNYAGRNGFKSKACGLPIWTEAFRKTLKERINAGDSFANAAGYLNRKHHTTFSRAACIGQMNLMRMRAGGVVVPRGPRKYLSKAERALQHTIRQREKRWAAKPSLEEQYKRKQEQAANRARAVDMGQSKTSRGYRVHMPKVANMSKAELREMLSQAVQNTAAMGIAA